MSGKNRESWGSSLGFILAAAGSAVGLGNIWKFPYVAGQNGGGLFVLIYLLCIALVGVPIMMAEIMVGRAAQQQPVAAFHRLAGRKTGWAAVGWMGVICGFVILSFYIVVAGWTMDYTLKSVINYQKPIYEEAQQKELNYVADTSEADMRETVASARAARASKEPVSFLMGDLHPTHRKLYEQFKIAVGEATDAVSAEAALLAEPRMAEAVTAGRAVDLKAELLRATILEEQRAVVADIPLGQLRDEAGTLIRRKHILARTTEAFLAMASDGWTCTFWAALFLLLCILIVGGGISGGIERACGVLMPTLFILILGMVVYGAFKPGFGEAVRFVFRPDVHKLRPSGVLEALGHAFFTLSLGMGAMITYGSYQRKKEGLFKESLAIALLDTGVALLACLMIFPVVFSFGQEPSAGPGLVFMSMPLAFAEIGQGGMLLSVLFFFLLTVAALTSAISLFEVVASYFIDEHEWPRHKAAWMLGGVVLAFGIPSAFAMDTGFLMSGWEPSFGHNFFDTMDYLASNWMLPLGGLFIAIYAGWVMPRHLRDAEIADSHPWVRVLWLLLCRFVSPALVLIVLLQKAGFIDADAIFHHVFH